MRAFILATTICAIVLCAGCGGGGGGGGGGGSQGNVTSVNVTVNWAARSRALSGPSSALSLLVTLKNAAAFGGDFTYTINRRSDPAAYTGNYTSTIQAKIGTWIMNGQFYSEPNLQASVVGTINGSVTIDKDGNGIGTLSTVSTIGSVSVTGSQTLGVGETADLAVTVKDKSGGAIAVTPGSVFVKVVSGADKLQVLPNQQIKGIAAGTASVTATVDGVASQPITITVLAAPLLSSVAVNPDTTIGPASSTGTVTLDGVARIDMVVTLSSSNTGTASVPVSVTVPVGKSSATFAITTHAVTVDTTVTISATLAGTTKTAMLKVVTPRAVASLSVSPASVPGGQPSTGTVTLTSTAPVGGIQVQLSSSDSHATVPASVTVLNGQIKATFTITTGLASADVDVTISATAGGVTKTAILTVTRFDVASLTLSPASLTGGENSTGTVTLTGAAPTGGKVVTLSSDAAAATVPASVNVLAGHTTATFTIHTTPVSSLVVANIGAKLATTVTSTLTINPPAVSKFALSPKSVWGGYPSTGTVTLNGKAATGGAVVTLASDKAEATVPATVTVAEGQTTATFTVSTIVVNANVIANITATAGGTSKSDSLTIKSYLIGSLSLSPSSVKGGESSTGTVTLTAAAGTGGVIVKLSSDIPSATVPPTVTIPEGQASATFTVNTTAVTKLTKTFIRATTGTSSGTAVLTINP